MLCLASRSLSCCILLACSRQQQTNTMATIVWILLLVAQLLLAISYTASSDEPFPSGTRRLIDNFDDITPSNSTSDYHHQKRHIKPITEHGEDNHHIKDHLFPIPSDGRGKDDRIIGGTQVSLFAFNNFRLTRKNSCSQTRCSPLISYTGKCW